MFLTHQVTGSFPKRALTKGDSGLPFQVTLAKLTPNEMRPFALDPSLGSASHFLG